MNLEQLTEIFNKLVSINREQALAILDLQKKVNNLTKRVEAFDLGSQTEEF